MGLSYLPRAGYHIGKMSLTPDARWLPFLKMTFGFLLLILLAVLCGVIALGKVEQGTSFGLQDILGGLLVLSGGFAQWCFATVKENGDGQTNDSRT